MYRMIITVILALIAHTLMIIGINMESDITNGSFFKKKIVDILVIITHYCAITSLYGALSKNKIVLIIAIVSSMFNFYIFASQLPIFVKYIKVLHGKNEMAMVISTTIGMLFSRAEVYFLLFMINQNWFIIEETISNSTVKTAFEFIYYTFSVSITYSGNGIEINGIIPKIAQMLHVLFFYLFAADAILKLAKNEE